MCECFDVIFTAFRMCVWVCFNDSSQLVFVKQDRVILMVFYDLELSKD